MSARSTNLKINNNTDYFLIKTESVLYHGVWSGNSEGTVPPNGQEVYVGQNDSDGAGTGDAGYINFAVVQVIDNTPQIVSSLTIGWDNPFIGSNSYSNSVSNSELLAVSNSNPDGDNPTVYYTLTTN